MARNFCGFVDFENQTNPQIAIQMADKLNLNQLYELRALHLSKAYFVSVYSKSFAAPRNSDFMEEMESRYEITSFSLLIRLDELGKKLGFDFNRSEVSDKEYILRSYLKWGKDMVHHLEGDWAFALWDQAKEELFIARNAHGDGTLFYYYSGNKIFFSSILTGLVGIEGIPNELDKEKLMMETLIASGFQSRTVYKNIHFLKPGHYGKVSRNGFELSQYWKPLDKPKVHFKKDEEYFEAYYEVFDRAVRDRLALTNHWGFALSGGLDSAGVTGMASNYFKERNETMEALCFVPNYKNSEEFNSSMSDGDERGMAQETADFNGNINLSLITKNPPLWKFLVDFTRDVGAPPHFLSILFADIIADAAKERNMTFVMTGQGGNQGLSFEGVPSHVSLSQYRSDLRYGLGDRLNTREFTQSLMKATYGSARKRLKGWSGGYEKAITKMLNERTLLSHDFVRSVNGYGLLKEHYFGTDKRTEGEFKFRKRLKPGKQCRLGLWNQLGTRYDIVFIDPTRDKHFLELLISFPNHIFNRKGDSKFLYKQALKGTVSPKVMNYKKQGRNMADLINRYHGDLEHLGSLIKSKENDELFNEMIDSEKLKTFYEFFEGEMPYSHEKIVELTFKSNSLFQGLLV